MYSYPGLTNHPRLARITPGTVVEHKYLPRVRLVVVSGPHKSLSGQGYIVEYEGKQVPVLEENLTIMR